MQSMHLCSYTCTIGQVHLLVYNNRDILEDSMNFQYALSLPPTCKHVYMAYITVYIHAMWTVHNASVGIHVIIL